MSKKCSISSTELFTIVSEHFSKSIKLEDFVPEVLQAIQSYLNCEQIFICYLNDKGEEEIITNKLEDNINHFQEIFKNYWKEEGKLPNFIRQNESDSSNNSETNEITQPLLKSELTLPILINTPQMNSFLLQNLWGVLFIYDYDVSRQWQKQEINDLKLVIKQMIVAIERNILYQELQLKEKEIQEAEILDNLTQLPNYNSFIDCLEFEWFRLAREKEPLSLIMIALDISNSDQKQIILPKIANGFLEIPTRISDLYARYSDTKFIIMLPKTNKDGASIVANKISHLIQKNLFNHDNITFNLSIVSCIPEKKLDYNPFLREAENSLNEAIQNKIRINSQEIN